MENMKKSNRQGVAAVQDLGYVQLIWGSNPSRVAYKIFATKGNSSAGLGLEKIPSKDASINVTTIIHIILYVLEISKSSLKSMNVQKRKGILTLKPGDSFKIADRNCSSKYSANFLS